jgi:hypothetical protein
MRCQIRFVKLLPWHMIEPHLEGWYWTDVCTWLCDHDQIGKIITVGGIITKDVAMVEICFRGRRTGWFGPEFVSGFFCGI